MSKIGADGTQVHSTFSTLGVDPQHVDTINQALTFGLNPIQIIALLVKYGPVAVKTMNDVVTLFRSFSWQGLKDLANQDGPVVWSMFQDFISLFGTPTPAKV